MVRSPHGPGGQARFPGFLGVRRRVWLALLLLALLGLACGVKGPPRPPVDRAATAPADGGGD